MQRLQKNNSKHTRNDNTQTINTHTPIPIRLQKRDKNNMAKATITIELSKPALEALEIPNPENKKTLKVECLTKKKTKEVLSDLHFKVLQTINEANTESEAMINLHEAFVWANKELQLKGENENNGQ